MAASCAKLRGMSCLSAVIGSFTLLATAQPVPPPDLSVNMKFGTVEFDSRNKTFVGSQPRIERDGIIIEAERAESTDLNFDDSTWTFTGKVMITTTTGHLRAAVATVRFLDNQLLKATIHGSADGAPGSAGATFEQQIEGSATPASGQADTIEYDVPAGAVWLRDNAHITLEGKDIRAELLLYNVNEQKIVANPEKQDGEGVRITIDPDSAGIKLPQ